MPGESLSFDIFANDRASTTFRRLSDQAQLAAGNVRQLGDRLDKLGSRVSTARVALDGDKEADAELDKLDVKLARLGKKIANPNITVEGAIRAKAEISSIDLALDRLDGKKATVTVDVDRKRGIFSRLSGLTGSAGGAAAGPGALISGLGIGASAASPYALGGLAALAALTLPALLPLTLGGGFGGLAAGGALAIGKKENVQLQKLNKALMTATGKQKRLLQQQIQQVQKTGGPELAIYGAFQDVGMGLLGSFTQALQSRGPGFSGGRAGHPGGASFATGLLGILKQIGGFVKTLSPLLGDLFRASIPYLKTFVQFGEQAAKTILPVITQSLKEMQPYLPILAKGLMNLVGGLAGFIKAIGPSGMQASAKIFVALTKAMAAILVGFGHTINWLSEHVPTWVHNIAAWFDRLRASVAHNFDNIKNAVLGWWHFWVDTWHKIVDAAASAWSIVVKGTKNAIGDIIHLFTGLPNGAIRALAGLGSRLWHLGAGWITSLWNGIKSVWGDVLHWFGGLPGSILHAIGIHSPPGWAVSAGKWIMKGLHIGISAASGLPLRLASSIAAKLGGLFSMGGGSAGAAQGIAASMLGTFGWGGQQMPSLIALWNRESGWNRFARNPSSGAYGIPQALPPTKMPFAAQAAGGSSAAAQIAWGLSYIKGRYGTPANAWAHELAFGWYGKGLSGGIFSSPTLIGVGERGPERVDITPLSSPHRGGGNTYNTVNVSVGAGTHPVAAAQEIVKLLNQGARNGVKLRTSILGPG